jgi:hypothetical protein
MFDEFITRTIGLPTGGELKELLIIDRRPYPIKFNPPLNAIIAGAAKFFRPRYEAVTEKEKAIYDELKADGLSEASLLKYSVYAQHFDKLKRMRSKGTWVAFLREKLKEDGWPDKDFELQLLKPIQKSQKRRLWHSEARVSATATSSRNKRANLGSGAPVATRPDQAAFDAEADAVTEGEDPVLQQGVTEDQTSDDGNA